MKSWAPPSLVPVSLTIVIGLAMGSILFAQSPKDPASASPNPATGSSVAEPELGDKRKQESPKLASDKTKEENKEEALAYEPLIKNDAVIFGFLALILGGIFWLYQLKIPWLQALFQIFPMLLLCYFVPSLLTFFRIVNPETSKLYFVASRYLLPASLVLLTISIDLREILNLGPKALIMFLVGTVGVVLGGPLSVWIVMNVRPDLVAGDEVWRGMSTVAGSWIGGGANQAAMKEIFGPSSEMYSTMVAVDVIVAEVWMMFLLIGVGKAGFIDRLFEADASAVEELKNKMDAFSKRESRNPTTTDLMIIMAVAFGVTGLSHWGADVIGPWLQDVAPGLKRYSLHSGFFWLVVLATTGGVALSFTRARKLEGCGASKVGTIFIYILVATIGLKMDISAVRRNPGMFVIGGIWMTFHVALMVIVGYLIKAPYFFLAVGSKANIGGAASAPVVAAAFHPSLAPVGVLLAVLGYALGTYGAWLSAIMMRQIATG